MKTKTTFLVVMCGAIALVTSPATPRAQSNIVWQTTFASNLCPDWSQPIGLQDGQVCQAGDGMQGWGGWSTANGSYDSITTAANYSGGGGGKGLRHMRGFGTTNNGSGLRVNLPSPMKELWVRFYMRYQAGFSFAGDQPHYTKDLYFNDTLQTDPVFTVGFHSGWYGLQIVRPGSINLIDQNRSNGYWQNIMRGRSGDGQYHAYEVHVKMDTNGANGIAETWVDGVLAHRHTNVDWGGSTGWTGWRFFVLGSNQDRVTSTTDQYTDFDDVAVSSTGYIGPIGGRGGPSSGSLPTAPANLRIAP